VWGDAPMLSHPDLEESSVRTMLEWIYSLESGAETSVVRPGFFGEVLVAAAGEARAPSGTLLLDASYTDTGGEKVGELTGRARTFLRTYKVEAEYFSWRQGTQTLASKSASAESFIGAIDDGSYLVFETVDLAGIARVRCRVSSAGAGATVEFRADAADGPLVASFELEPNGAWEDWFDLEAKIRDPGGPHDLFVLFSNPGAAGGLMNIDSMEFLPE